MAAGASTLAARPHAFARTPRPYPGVVPPIARDRYDLTIGRTPLHIDGKFLNAPSVDGGVPGPVLRWREGDTVTLNIRNTLDEPTSIHWHGIRLPADMDGVPGLSFRGIPPGETFTYRFPVRQSGSYWYHSHSGGQEAQGLYGAIVIDPEGGDTIAHDRDYSIVLSDWSDVPPADIVDNLKMNSDYYSFRQRTVASLFGQARQQGLMGAIGNRLQWARMRMAATDISDVSGVIYSHLMNGLPPDANWTGLFKPGERVRLRFVNASAMSFYDVRIPGLEMSVVQADGNDIVPVPVDEFRIGVAETYDVIVQPRDERAYTIFVQSEDRTGHARGTLAPRYGMSAPVPPMDPRPVRTMVDMGMGNMPMHDHAMPMPPAPASQAPMSQPPKDDMPDMDMPDMDMPPHDKPATAAKPVIEDPGPPPLNVENQNVAAMPIDRLGSPGDGLENNGRRVLNYRQLRALRRGTDLRPPTREIVIHLTGNMTRYIWGFDGRKFSEAAPVMLRLGERVRFTLINDTMMEHPIHLHGLWSELENGQGDFRPYKHTVISQPGSKLSYLVTADAPGRWAFHCHLMYHMDLGMFRTVIVA
nr:copper resistance system multicopper oxidase [Neoasaia chiangmaiensis]